MHFCTRCSNMYYIKVGKLLPYSQDQYDGNVLVYYCRNCGYEDETVSTEHYVVSSTQLKKSEQEFSHIINQYTKLDPTLPRMTNILCPNDACPSNLKKKSGGFDETKDPEEPEGQEPEGQELEEPEGEREREIIYIRYDELNLKYVYLCCQCDHVWKTADKT